jgi:TonB family protein
MGEKGTVAVKFIVLTDGSLSEQPPTVESSSGKKELDNASVAAIRASAPFEHLPETFKGSSVELRLTFLYNVPPAQHL